METGICGVEVIVPEITLASVDVGDAFTKKDGAFFTEGL